MFNPRVNSILTALELQIGHIDLGTQTAMVVVGVRNTEGTRWFGRVSKGPNPDPQEYLVEAFEAALVSFDPTWKTRVDSLISGRP